MGATHVGDYSARPCVICQSTGLFKKKKKKYFKAIKGEEFDVNAKANFNELPPLIFSQFESRKKKGEVGGGGSLKLAEFTANLYAQS